MEAGAGYGARCARSGLRSPGREGIPMLKRNSTKVWSDSIHDGNTLYHSHSRSTPGPIGLYSNVDQ